VKALGIQFISMADQDQHGAPEIHSLRGDRLEHRHCGSGHDRHGQQIPAFPRRQPPARAGGGTSSSYDLH